MGKCPFCAEQIQDGVVKCPFCGEVIKRPAFINFLTNLFLILFVLNLLPAFAALIANAPHGTPLDIALDIFHRILFLVTPVVLWYARAGLLRMKNWGRIITLITFIMWPCVAFVDYIYTLGNSKIQYSSAYKILLNSYCFIIVLFCIVMIFYFTRPRVKELFVNKK